MCYWNMIVDLINNFIKYYVIFFFLLIKIVVLLRKVYGGIFRFNGVGIDWNI